MFAHTFELCRMEGRRNKQAMLTIAEVAQELGISRSTLYELVRRKKISHRRVGTGRGRILFSATDVQEYLETCKVERHSLSHSARFTHQK